MQLRAGEFAFRHVQRADVLTRQCLDRRIQDKATLIEQVAAWNADRNTRHAKVNWRFTTADARIKLKRLYPRFE